ncbi:hypothetical protein [Calditerricola satsumensis]|uniref:Uncharacterized protein n=1 Tax=Calditerricola satsumensis TaxID=373054 RepID=A0A8J3BAC0_9BACI|nr:hypothetical protein [Calditerricola satsumensis]GGJ92666.1 hypothetical protein GCM10007043_02930 [Calditerricola satsumensis]
MATIAYSTVRVEVNPVQTTVRVNLENRSLVDETVRVVVFNATVSPKTPVLDQLLVVPANGTNTVDFTFPLLATFDYEVEVRTTSPFVVPYITGLDAGLAALSAQTFTYGDLLRQTTDAESI